MPQHDVESSRHRPPRQECIDAGWDFSHEASGGDEILMGETRCPACRPRVIEKEKMRLQIALLEEQRRANDLKERELEILNTREYPESRPRYTPPPPVPKLQKGGINIEPRST